MLAGPKCLVAAALALMTLTGCGPNPDAPGARGLAGADTAGPRALLADWHASLVAGDKGAYLACFVGSEEELVLALAVQEVVRSSYAFHDAVVAAYGPAGWEVFRRSKGARVSLMPREPGWVRTITVARMGEMAFGYVPKGRVPLHLSRGAGVWRLHASSLVPPGLDAGRAADYLFRYAAVLRQLVEEVRQKQVEAARASMRMEKDFLARVAPDEQAEAGQAVDAFLVP